MGHRAEQRKVEKRGPGDMRHRAEQRKVEKRAWGDMGHRAEQRKAEKNLLEVGGEESADGE